jgi:hypothetical protein
LLKFVSPHRLGDGGCHLAVCMRELAREVLFSFRGGGCGLVELAGVDGCAPAAFFCFAAHRLGDGSCHLAAFMRVLVRVVW